AKAAVELLVGEPLLALGDGRLEPLPDPVQQHAALAVAHLAQRKRELALAPEVADAHVLDRVARLRGGDRRGRLLLVLLPVRHGRGKLPACPPTTGSHGSTTHGR